MRKGCVVNLGAASVLGAMRGGSQIAQLDRCNDHVAATATARSTAVTPPFSASSSCIPAKTQASHVYRAARTGPARDRKADQLVVESGSGP